jgi:hypothetical protein
MFVFGELLVQSFRYPELDFRFFRKFCVPVEGVSLKIAILASKMTTDYRV